MKWPWVSRAYHENLLRQWEDQWKRAYDLVTKWEERYEKDSKRYDDLLARFTMLRMQGAVEPRTFPDVTIPPVTADVDPCLAAINAKFSGSRRALRKAAVEQLAKDRALGIDDEAILAKIEQGESTNDWIPV